MAQDVDSIPHKNYKYIHIISNDSNQMAYRSFGQFLTDKGWSISTGNIDFLSITTLFSHIDKTSATVGFQIAIRKNDIKLCIYRKSSSELSTNILGISKDSHPAKLREYDNTDNTWQRVTGMLSAYPHTKIYYSLD